MSAEKHLLEELRIERKEPVRRSPWRIAIALLIPAVLLILTAGFFWLKAARAPEVTVAVVREESAGNSATVLNASGYVTPRLRATVSSKITGKVTEVLIEEGKSVTAGQVVGRLDDSNARRDLDLAEAQLVSARKSLAETEARLRLANITLQRMRTLVKEGVESQSTLDSAQADADALSAHLNQQREDVAVAEQTVAVRRQNVEDTIIRAPFSGVVTTKDAQPGEMISPVSAGGGFTRTGICTVVDMKSLEIQVDVNESYISRVFPGQAVQATLDAYPDWQIPAHVILAVPTADRQKATVQVRIKFDKLDPRILPDMGVKVAFLEKEAARTTESKPRLLVPKAAVRHEGDADVVYVVQQDHVERRAVKVVGTSGAELEISGVTRGERVVLEGPPGLADGSRVTVR
ncbi:MAG TPA: efflux RND transporter periplasmic adaptor subunit [Candidatus Acidoferrales bacterium]|nr:efflux RND transporter periplasmic adaptor subunit [Candidatus Acidoferrales bacterium]